MGANHSRGWDSSAAVDVFAAALRDGGDYHTPLDQRPGAVVRWLRGRTIFFHASIAAIIFGLARVAKAGRMDRAAWQRGSYDVFRAVERAGGRLHVTGVACRAAMPGPCVYVANHMSSLETYIFPAIFLSFGDVSFVVKESLLSYPVFGHVMTAAEPISVTRDNAKADFSAVMEQGAAFLAAKRSVVIFPQTTRTDDFCREQFNSLGVKLARKAGVPVTPIALKTDFAANGCVLKDFGRVRVDRDVRIHIFEPLTVTGTGKAEHARVTDMVANQLSAWGVSIRD